MSTDQKQHSLIHQFEDMESFFLPLTIGSMGQTYRNFMFAGITSQWWDNMTRQRFCRMCHRPRVLRPRSALRSVEPSSASAVLCNEMGQLTCKAGFSVDGTPGGATSYEARCGSSGLFLFSVQECFDVDCCAGTPCGANGQFSDCSTGWCERGSTRQLTTTHVIAPWDTRPRLALLER